MAQAAIPFELNMIEQRQYEVWEKNHHLEWRKIQDKTTYYKAIKLVNKKPWSRELR